MSDIYSLKLLVIPCVSLSTHFLFACSLVMDWLEKDKFLASSAREYSRMFIFLASQSCRVTLSILDVGDPELNL